MYPSILQLDYVIKELQKTDIMILFYSIPPCSFSSLSKIFLIGLIAASLHSSLMSDPEYPSVAYTSISVLFGK